MTAPDHETPSTSWAVWAWQAYRDGRLVEANETRASLAEALAVVLEALKDGEVWGRAVNAATPILRSDLDQSAWVTVDETREAIEAALRAIGGDA